MERPSDREFFIAHKSDVSHLRRVVKDLASALGFGEMETEEVVLAASELATNLVNHAGKGRMLLKPLEADGRFGLEIESVDEGPGIFDIEEAMTDGFSTGNSLGYGLGTVNRIMDEIDITSGRGKGTHITCKRMIRIEEKIDPDCPLTFGAATRPHPAMKVNGDAFIIKQWGSNALVGIIDGLGHGQWAHRASQTARSYIETHYEQSMQDIFRGVNRSCRSTRGVVLALARFDWSVKKVTYAMVGNVEVRVFNTENPPKFIIRRGIVGLNAPNPVVNESDWDPEAIMVMYSDGLRSHWEYREFPTLVSDTATVSAQQLLRGLARDNDDATVVVVKGRGR